MPGGGRQSMLGKAGRGPSDEIHEDRLAWRLWYCVPGREAKGPNRSKIAILEGMDLGKIGTSNAEIGCVSPSLDLHHCSEIVVCSQY